MPTWNCQNSMLNACNFRQDESADVVKSRCDFARNLPAVDAVYHNQCNIDFRLGKHTPYNDDT